MRLKRIGCVMLAVALILSVYTPVSSYGAAKFPDAAGHWAERYINEAVSVGFVGGYPDGKFKPDKAVTRAEFATMINKALGNSGTANISFKDVSSKEWYYTDVSKALAASYAAGYSDGTFKPNSPITRQEAAVMLSRIVTAGRSGNLKSYSDSAAIGDWAYDAMAKVNGKGYIGAYNDGKIHPLDQLTRAQTAKIICEILDEESIVTGNTTVKDDGTKLSGKIYTNNVTIHKDLKEGSATIENSVILGSLYVYGGGPDTVTISNSRISTCIVDKGADPVRILAKGETSVSELTAGSSSVLQTSGLTGGLLGPGFGTINVKGSAKVTLKGSFPKVSVNGSDADVVLDSGTISDLAVTSAGKSSDITVASGATVTNATVNAESYFHGSGTISHMGVNANNVTYETKPKNWTIASSVKSPTYADQVLDVTFSPKNGATNVKLDAKITLTFSSAMKLYNGKSITSSNIKDFITVRKNSSSGTTVGFSAAIDNARKVITITPDSYLTDNTKYYVALDKNALQDEKENGNAEKSIYFTTGKDADNVSATYSPADSATGVSINPNITITFSEAVARYNSNSSISSSYLKECLVFRKTNSGGAEVPYSASINSANKVITITPDKALDLNQKYYVAVVAKKLTAKSSETAVPSSSVTWTTGVTTPVLSALTLTPGETSMKVDFTPNLAGDVYALAISGSNLVPTEDQILKGTRTTVKANTASTLTISNLSPNTPYTVYALLRSGNVNSKVVSASYSTKISEATLNSLTVSSGGQNRLGSFSAGNKTYTVLVPFGTDKVEVAATAGTGIAVEINGRNTAQTSVDLSGVKNEIRVKASASGKADSIYTITVQVQGNTEVSSVTLGDKSFGPSDSYGTSVAYDATKIAIQIVARDSSAAISLGTQSGMGTLSLPEEALSPGGNTTFTFTISSHVDSKTYTITITREAPPPPAPDQSPNTNPDQTSTPGPIQK